MPGLWARLLTMPLYESETCEECERTCPVTNTLGQTIMAEYNGEMLCSSCRVDKRLADNDFSNDD